MQRTLAIITGTVAALLVAPPLMAGTFTLAGIHPDATNQPTSTGRVLAALAGFNGKVYAGFGDYTANNGPIGIRSFNPDTGVFSARLLNSSTEAIYLFRMIGGNLYAPDIDPVAGESSGGYALGTASGATESWRHKSPVSATHMYDIASHGGSLWMAGSLGNNAIVWRSMDNGTNWSVSLSIPPSGGYSYVRIYGMAAYNERLYVEVDAESKSHVFDGTAWSDGPRLTYSGFMSNPNTFAGHMVYQSFQCGLGASRMFKFDGVAASYLGTNSFYDYKIVGTRLYGLVPVYAPGAGGGSMGGGVLTNMEVRFTEDLTNWQTVAVAPITARSLAIVNQTLFLGAVNAQLLRYDEPIGPLPRVDVQVPDADASEEGPDDGTLLIRRNGDTRLSLTINFAIAGTASNGVDYAGLQDGALVFAPGSNERSFTVTPIPDGQTEGREKVILTLLTNAAYDIYGPNTGIVSIVDLPRVSMLGTDPNAWEWPVDAATVTVTRIGYVNQPLSVNLSQTGTATTNDFTLNPGLSVPFAAGVTSVTVTLKPVFDTNVENTAETVILGVQTNAAYLVDLPSNATVSIQDVAMPNTTNGTPITWLRRYGLVTNLFDRMDGTDTDHDGMAAWEEYWAGTDPTNSSSVFKIISLDNSNRIMWLGGTNGATVPYQVLRSTNLADASWQLGTNYPRSLGISGTNVWRDPFRATSSSPHVFYRIAVPTD